MQFQINRGEEHSLHIDEDIMSETTLMCRAYQSALSALKGIFANSFRYFRSEKRTRRQNSYETTGGVGDEVKENDRAEISLYEYPSNLIVFCGDRGQGKTSTLMSFVRAFQDLGVGGDKDYQEKLFRQKELFRYLTTEDSRNQDDAAKSSRNGEYGGSPESSYVRERRRFYDYDEDERRVPQQSWIDYIHVLPPVEPNMMCGQDTVMSVILSKLFFQAEHILKNPAIKDVDSDRLIHAFRKCYQEARTIQASSSQFEAVSDCKGVSLDSLYQLGDSLDLKQDFYRLLRQFFKIQGKDPDKSFMMICLDDTDLQFQRAYEILEDIRKYLSLPNVIVVMCAHMEQLRKLVIQHYYTKLRVIVDRGEISPKAIRMIASKYLNKLIPATHTIYLPDIGAIYASQSSLDLVVSGKNLGDLQERIIKNIYRKTGIVFIRDSERVHSIIPRTWRDIMQLLRLFDTMQDTPDFPILSAKDNDSEAVDEEEWNQYCLERLNCVRIRVSNLTKFEEYFLNCWCDSNLNTPYRALMLELKQNAPLSHTVSYAAEILKYRMPDMRAEYGNEPINVSVGGDLFVTERSALRSEGSNINVSGNMYVQERSQVDLGQQKNSAPVRKRDESDYWYFTRAISELDTASHTQDESLFGFALHVYVSIRLHKEAAEIQTAALDKYLYRNELIPLGSDFFAEPVNTQSEVAFAFDFKEIAEQLNPKLFDSEQLQASFNQNPFLFPNMGVFFAPVSTSTLSGLTLNNHLFFDFGILQGPSPVRVHTWFDLLYCFFQALRREVALGQKVQLPALANNQRAVMNLQDMALYVCCNWDVQAQISRNLDYSVNPSSLIVNSNWVNPSKTPGRTENAGAYVNGFFDALFRSLWYAQVPGIDSLLKRFPEWINTPEEGRENSLVLEPVEPLDFVSHFLPPGLRDEELQLVALPLEKEHKKTKPKASKPQKQTKESTLPPSSETEDSAPAKSPFNEEENAGKGDV